MRALQSPLSQKRHLSPEWHQALQLLAGNPRGMTEHMLVLGHGFSSDMLMSTTKYAASSLESGHTCCRNFRRKMDESSEVGSVIAHREDDGPPP